MPRLPLAFFTAATVCALCGMVWGAVMGSNEDFTLAPAHAHLNLVGWATLALMGAFYALSKQGGRLGWLNFWLSTVGVAIFVPSLALMLAGVKAATVGVMIGPLLALLGMLVFLWMVLAAWRAPKPLAA